MKGRRFVALVLAAALAVSMSGCGKNKDNNFQTGDLGVNNQKNYLPNSKTHLHLL